MMWMDLHAAASRNIVEVVDVLVLVEFGANIKARANQGLASLYDTSEWHCLEASLALLKHGDICPGLPPKHAAILCNMRHHGTPTNGGYGGLSTEGRCARDHPQLQRRSSRGRGRDQTVN